MGLYMKNTKIKNNSFYLISLLLIVLLYYSITQLLFPMFSVMKVNFSIIDILYIYLFSIISYILSDKNNYISYFFIIVAVFSFFAIEPLGITIESKPLFFTDMPDLYPSLIEVLPLYMKIMAVDYGDARTGLAACDRTEFLASPSGGSEERNFWVFIGTPLLFCVYGKKAQSPQGAKEGWGYYFGSARVSPAFRLCAEQGQCTAAWGMSLLCLWV